MNECKYDRVLVTGSSGFVGSAIARRLGSGFIPCDLKMGSSLSQVASSSALSGVDTVLHLAATQYFTPGVRAYEYATFHEGNVVAVRELIDACVRHGVRKFIHVSTDMVYGPPDDGHMIREHEPLQPVGHYGRSKAAAEEVVRQAEGKIPVITILRPRVIGGPGRGGLFATLANLVRQRLPVPLFGRGGNRFQLSHVEDLASLLQEAIDRDVPGTFNVGSTQVSTMREKVDVVGRCCGVKPMVVSIPDSAAVAACSLLYRFRLGPLHPEQFRMAGREFVLSMERTLDHFAWRPRYSDNEIVEDAIKALLAAT